MHLSSAFDQEETGSSFPDRPEYGNMYAAERKNANAEAMKIKQ